MFSIFCLQQFSDRRVCCVLHTSPFHSLMESFETWSQRRDVHRIHSSEEASLPSFLTAHSSCDKTSFHDRPVIMRRSFMIQKQFPSTRSFDVTWQLCIQFCSTGVSLNSSQVLRIAQVVDTILVIDLVRPVFQASLPVLQYHARSFVKSLDMIQN